MGSGERIEQTTVLLKRLDVLERLWEAPAHVRDLVEDTDHSRRTINRAVTELEAGNFVRRGTDGVELTMTGRLAHDQLTTFLGDLDDVTAAGDVLEPLAAEPDIEPDVVVGGEVISSSQPTSFRALERVYDSLADADCYRALIPTIEDARHVRLLYEHVVTEGNPAELVVSEEVFEALRVEFPRRTEAMATQDGFSVFVGDVPRYGLGLFEDGSGSEALTTVTVFTDGGGVHGILANETDRAIRCARDRYASYRAEATDLTSSLIPDTDGGTQTHDVAVRNTSGQSLPVSLERAGFVAVDVPYFRDAPVADPVTAWRAGLSLPEVHTGYAISRVQPPDGEVDHAAEAPTLAATITDEVTLGTDCAVVGPPGSGKSTICKRVACEWYGADRGPVFYRPGGRGRPFTAVADLVATLEAAEGHALVVVEDAARPDANAVFEALDRLADRPDVSFLLDSREHEWYDRDVPRGVDAGLEVTFVPPVREQECEALVEHFERTAGRSIDVSVEQLRSAARDVVATDGTTSHELLRLTHRLATAADPLLDEPTALEDAVAAVREEFADDELGLTVCTLANTLVAAGIGLERALLYAVAEPGSFDAVDDAVDRLEGRVIFAQENGGYRTIHEEWATTFLRQSVDTDETAASERFRSAVTALLALADDADRCERISRRLDDRTALEDVLTRPERWADDVAEAMFDLFYRQLMLAPLFGDGSHPPFDLPDACSDSVEAKGPYWLGQRFLEASYLDRGERAFERLCDDEPTERKKRLCGLGRIAYKRAEYHDAMAYLEAGLPIAQEQGDLTREFIFHKHLGLVHWRLGAYDDGRDHLETCIELARSLDDPRLEGKAHTSLGGIAWAQGQYECARASNEFQLERTRETGDRYGEATSINNLGLIAQAQGAYDRAETRHEEALAIAREFGFRSTETHCLNNLGHIASARGLLEEAVAFHEEALELSEKTDSATHRGESHWRLGAVAIDRGDYEDARRHLEESKTIFTEVDDRTYLTRITLERARLALECGESVKAHRMASEAHDLARDLGAENERARCRKLLGRIALGENDPDGALEHWTAALEVFEERGMSDAALEVLELLVDLWHDDGDEEEARRWHRHARELWADAPSGTADIHREWVTSSPPRT